MRFLPLARRALFRIFPKPPTALKSKLPAGDDFLRLRTDLTNEVSILLVRFLFRRFVLALLDFKTLSDVNVISDEHLAVVIAASPWGF